VERVDVVSRRTGEDWSWVASEERVVPLPWPRQINSALPQPHLYNRPHDLTPLLLSLIPWIRIIFMSKKTTGCLKRF